MKLSLYQSVANFMRLEQSCGLLTLQFKEVSNLLSTYIRGITETRILSLNKWGVDLHMGKYGNT